MKNTLSSTGSQRLAVLLLGGLLSLWTCQTAAAQGMQAQIPASEYDALVDLYNATSGASWGTSSGWLNPEAASWYGVSVLDGHVTELSLEVNQLSGGIPSSLGNLSQLVILDLGNNQLSGSIPSSLGNLSQLVWLVLDYNQLSGSIPTNLGNLSQLEYLYLYANQLSGSIPSSLGNLSRLVWFVLDNNQLSGSIPSSLGNLSQLEYLYLYANQLSGSIPTNLGNLSQLGYLVLSTNQLSGSIPSSLGNLSQLSGLVLDYNQLSGNIPTNLGNLSQLGGLFLDNNQLSGSIPAGLGNLSQLEDLYLENNQLSGDVPDFTAFTGAYIVISSNYLNIAAGSQSLANINAMITAGNTVLYTPQNNSPLFEPIVLLLGGTPQLALTGEPGQYTVQASTDLTNWAVLTNLTLTNNSGQFVDASATNYLQRFYRTVSQ